MNDWTISQSATNLLDISDDEGKPGKLNDDRGKENIDPNEVDAPMTRSMAAAMAASDALKKDLMTDDRIPLGEVNPAKFYPEGLDATSVVLVQDDAAEEESPEHEDVAVVEQAADFTFQAEQVLPSDIYTSDIGAVIMSSVPDREAQAQPVVEQQQQVVDSGNDIPHLEPGEALDIWESESAKDENESNDKQTAAAGESIFALSEL